MSPLATLACGSPTGLSPLAATLRHLSASIDDRYLDCLHAVQGEWSERQLRVYAPYLGRSLLEIVTAALLSRIDPLRILALRECQLRPTYDPATRHGLAIQWTGDILPPRSDRSGDLWSADRSSKDFSRALFGDHLGDLCWRRAFDSCVDATDSQLVVQWIADLRGMTSESFLPRVRQRLTQAYSSLSKGVHHEFVAPLTAYTDVSNMKGLLEEVLEVCATIGLVGAFVDNVPFAVNAAHAVECIAEVYEEAVRS